MRVLHLGKYLPPHPGGIERFLAELMPAQRRGGVTPAAIVHDEGNDGRPRCRLQARAAVVRAPVAATVAYTPISPRWPFQLHRLIRRWRPDVLHLHLPNPSAFWALALPLARRLPWLVHWHADVPVDAIDRRVRLLYRIYQPLETAVLRRARTIVATSTAYAQSSVPLRRWQSKVEVVPLGMDDQPLATPAPTLWPEATRYRLLFVGRFSYYKGLDHLIDAMTALPADISLLLVGDGDQRESIERKVRTLGLSARVLFAGALSDADLAQAYAAADVLCLPSIERSEAFGMVLLEAMRVGLPAIATAVEGSGMASVLGDGEAGLIVPPGDAPALATAIGQLRSDSAFAGRLGASGRRRFTEHFLIDRVATRLEALYRPLVRHR